MSFDETQHPRSARGTFADKPQSAPDVALDTRPLCTEGCGQPAEYRHGNVPRGYRSPETEAALCAPHAAQTAGAGGSIEEFPRPQAPGEVIVWLIEGDDREYERVEAATEDEALDIAADRFEDRYGGGDEDEEDGFDRESCRDMLTVAGTFRGEADGYSDELEFVPYGDIDENTAYATLDNAA